MEASHPNTFLPISAQSTCLLCGSTINAPYQSQYNSAIKLLWCHRDMGCWALGSHWLLYESSHGRRNDEVETMRLFARKSALPVPNILMEWKEADGRKFTIIAQRPFSSEPLTVLADSWSTYTPVQKNNIARSVANHLARLRQFESPCIQTPVGSVVDLRKLFGHDKLYPSCQLRSDIDVWDEMKQQIPSASAETQALLNMLMPQTRPYVLTHGKLSPHQILMRGQQVFAFTGMGNCVYAPCWWEYVALGNGEFAELVRRHMPCHEGARIFWNQFMQYVHSEGATTMPATEQGDIMGL